MRTRAYRPEAPNCLEDRSLLSSVAGPPADPVVLPVRTFNDISAEVRASFQLLARNSNIFVFPTDFQGNVVRTPFGRVDGLGLTLRSILRTMHQGRLAGVPNTGVTAQNEMIAAIRAQVAARVQAGDVVIR